MLADISIVLNFLKQSHLKPVILQVNACTTRWSVGVELKNLTSEFFGLLITSNIKIWPRNYR